MLKVTHALRARGSLTAADNFTGLPGSELSVLGGGRGGWGDGLVHRFNKLEPAQGGRISPLGSLDASVWFHWVKLPRVP